MITTPSPTLTPTPDLMRSLRRAGLGITFAHGGWWASGLGPFISAERAIGVAFELQKAGPELRARAKALRHQLRQRQRALGLRGLRWVPVERSEGHTILMRQVGPFAFVRCHFGGRAITTDGFIVWTTPLRPSAYARKAPTHEPSTAADIPILVGLIGRMMQVAQRVNDMEIAMKIRRRLHDN